MKINTEQEKIHKNIFEESQTHQIAHKIWEKTQNIYQENLQNFNKKLWYFVENNIISAEKVRIIDKILAKNPEFCFGILPITLDYRDFSEEEIIAILENSYKNEDFFGKKIAKNSFADSDFYNYIDAYFTENFSKEELRKLYQENEEIFIKMFYWYFYKGKKPHSYLEEIVWFPQDYTITKGKYWLSEEEQEIFGFMYRENRFDFFADKKSIFHKIIFENFVRKLPKFSGTVYRGIAFKWTENEKEKRYNDFMENPAKSIAENIQNFSTKKSVPESFANQNSSIKYKVLIEITNDNIRALSGILYDTESHAWFEAGTEFEVLEIIPAEEKIEKNHKKFIPTIIKMRVKNPE